MKHKYSLVLLLIFTAICIVITSSKAYSADITVGATTWYAWWDTSGASTDSAFLYGPALGVKFNDDFNLTFVYLYGKFDFEKPGVKTKLKRSDSDLAVNYRLSDYFKVFAGIKYLAASMTEFEHTAYGPGLGLSAALPLYKNIFLLGTLSGFYLWADQEEGGVNSNPHDYGINTMLSIAYYIAPASTTVSLGGRYQYLKHKVDEDTGPDSEKFYGITLTATYTFSI
ncbi:MAG: porin family protein [Spirochaetes bacterium]|nr:porin family protein [Spirochaetota bacterium]